MGEEHRSRDTIKAKGSLSPPLSPSSPYHRPFATRTLLARKGTKGAQPSVGRKEKACSFWLTGEGRLSQAQAGRALDAFRRAVNLDPRRGWYRVLLGRAYRALGRYQEAINEFEKACELVPTEPLYRLELADLHLLTNRLDDAIEQLKIACHWAPEDAFYQVRLALACLLASRFEDAVGALEEAVRLSPWNASYHCLLSAVYQKLGQRERAAWHGRFRWRLDAYDRHFLKKFHRAIGGILEER